MRTDSSSFINHLRPYHLFEKVMLVSGDRESEVRYLAEQSELSMFTLVKAPNRNLNWYVKNPSCKNSLSGDVLTTRLHLPPRPSHSLWTKQTLRESADAVIMDSSLLKVDELFHIGERMRKIALQSAVGGMALSLIGMVFAGLGYLTPVAGAVTQEVIDVFAVLNALRAAIPLRRFRILMVRISQDNFKSSSNVS